MNTFSKFQITSSIFMFITINVLFYFKYAARISMPIGIVAVTAYLIFACLVYILNKRSLLRVPGKVLFVFVFLFLIGSVLVLSYIPKETLNVDRWEMIQLFWDTTFKGIYPYGVASPGGNYPGPMPFYFILCLPFYLVGEIGYAAIAGVLIWFFYIHKTEKGALPITFILLFSSLPIYWEIFARSTIFFNACLFALFLFNLEKLNGKTSRQFYLLAAIGGLLFSTRNIFVISMIIWGVYALKQEKIPFKRLFQWGFCFLVFFALSFLPFVLLNPSECIKMNPFIIQSTVLIPFPIVLCFVLSAFLAGFFCNRFQDVIYYNAVLLFLTITGHVIYAVLENGFDGYLHAGADISYYLFSFPFLLKILAGKTKGSLACG